MYMSFGLGEVEFGGEAVVEVVEGSAYVGAFGSGYVGTVASIGQECAAEVFDALGGMHRK